MFEMSVEDIFTITGVGTVFAGTVVTGSISIGDPILCRTSTVEVPVRVIRLQDASGHALKRGEPGGIVGVVCNTIDLSSLRDAFIGEGENRKASGVRLVSAPAKKHWWQ